MATKTLTLAAVHGQAATKASVANRSRTFDPTKAIWAAAVTRWDSNNGVQATYYYATRNKFTAWSAPADNVFAIRLRQPAIADRQAFGAHRTAGRSDITVGNVVLTNALAGLDVYRMQPVDGRRLLVSYGMNSDDYPSGFTTVLDATMQSEFIGQETDTITLRDWQGAALVPLQTSVYGGSNVLPAGIDGSSDIQGKPKPVCLGQVRNVTPICVNTSKLIYQLSDGLVSSASTVYDMGVPLASGLTWAAGTSPAFGDINGTAVNDSGTIVALGGGGTIEYSTDRGVTWNATGIATGTIFNKVAWGNGIFMAVGASPGPGTSPGQLYTSPDGITWTSRSASHGLGNVILTSAAFGVTSAGNVWVITALSNLSAYSLDNGVSWAASGASLGGAPDLNHIAFGGGRFVIVANNGRIATSTTGNSGWVNSTFGSGTNLNGVEYGAGLWVITGNSGLLATSVDAMSWTNAVSNTTNVIRGCRFGNGKFLFSTSAGELALSFDGFNWNYLALPGLGTPDIRDIAYGSSIGQFVIVGASNFIALSAAPGQTYANSTDLQDDSLAPAPGTFKALYSSSGSYIRLGSQPAGTVTADVLQGANAAARTAGQLFTQVLTRAGFTTAAGDWSTSDITALDSANSAVCGYYSTDPGVTCADALDEIAASVGAGWWTDASGVIRIKRLDNPAPNLISQPDNLATSWTTSGTCFGTNAVAIHVGHAFSRISNIMGGNMAIAVTFATDGQKECRWRIHTDGAVGASTVGLHDDTAGSFILSIAYAVAADGSVIVSASAGSVTRLALLGDGVYQIVGTSTSATAAHTHSLYANNSSVATLTSIQMGGVTAYDGDVVVTLSSLNGTSGEIIDINPVASADPNGGIPCPRTTINYSKNYTPLTGADLAGSVTDAARVTFGAEWLSSPTSVDTAVQTAHPLSVDRIDNSLIASATDAATEATRKQSLFGTERYWFDIVCLMTATTATIELGDVVDVVTDRYLMGAGQRMRVLGIRPDAAAGTITFSCWF